MCSNSYVFFTQYRYSHHSDIHSLMLQLSFSVAKSIMGSCEHPWTYQMISDDTSLFEQMWTFAEIIWYYDDDSPNTKFVFVYRLNSNWSSSFPLPFLHPSTPRYSPSLASPSIPIIRKLPTNRATGRREEGLFLLPSEVPTGERGNNWRLPVEYVSSDVSSSQNEYYWWIFV